MADNNTIKNKDTKPQKNENTNQSNNKKTDSKGIDKKDSQNPKTSNADIQKHKPWLVKHVWWVDALLFIGGTILLGGLATLLGGQMFNFQSYKMPPGTAPKLLFPIAWSIIYIAIGVSTFLMWRDKEIKSKDRKINLIIYFVHMFFNVLWPLFFFRLDLPIISCVWLLFVVITAIVVAFRYFICNLPAGIIFSIYVIWLIYAMYLNLGLVLLNFVA